MDSLDIFESQKGKQKLAFKKLIYVEHKECLNFIRWKCCRKNSHKCPCVLKTSTDKKHFFKIDHEHNHHLCQNEINAAKIKMQIKKRATTTKSTPAQLFSKAVTESILEELPKDKSIKKNNSKSKDSELHFVFRDGFI